MGGNIGIENKTIIHIPIIESPPLYSRIEII